MKNTIVALINYDYNIFFFVFKFFKQGIITISINRQYIINEIRYEFSDSQNLTFFTSSTLYRALKQTFENDMTFPGLTIKYILAYKYSKIKLYLKQAYTFNLIGVVVEQI